MSECSALTPNLADGLILPPFCLSFSMTFMDAVTVDMQLCPLSQLACAAWTKNLVDM